MSVLNLESLLCPKSVALIGASNRAGTLGFVVMRNLQQGGFTGPIWPVNPKYDSIASQPAFANVSSLPGIPDLAVIATPAPTIPKLIQELGEKGTRAAVVLSSGTNQSTENGQTIDGLMLNAARPFGLRILGPNCVGLLLPNVGLNASFAHTNSLPGRLALISQSGALCTSLLDWAKSRNIGFSHFISLGNALDVDFGDLLNFLSNDRQTDGILLYIESIDAARKFMSAARATARNKPVVVIKAGRFEEGARAAASHTGALAGSDDVFDSALRRAGMLRVHSIEDLFTAVETLARARRVAGNRLAILTNGGGPGVLATDALISRGGKLAELKPATVAALNQLLPASWSRNNPVDIIGDGGAERYVKALRIMLDDSSYDAILVMLVPAAVIDNEAVAHSVAAEINKSRQAIFTCWLGADAVDKARQHFEREGVPNYETPDAAVDAFMMMFEHQANQHALMQTPPSVPEAFYCDTKRVREILLETLKDQREILTEAEAKEVLKAYGIPVVETRVARTVDQAVELARVIGYPVALKVLSPEITHKSDVGGVQLNIESESQLRAAADGMLMRIKQLQPTSELIGFTVQQMVRRPGAYELIVGSTSDPIFGPAILFGQGGTAVEVVNDKSLALPPLNMILAEDLIQRTRIFRKLRGYRDTPAVNLEAVKLVLIKVSQLIADHPQIEELDINPLFADPAGVVAIDARIRVRSTEQLGAERFAICPYPSHEEEWVTLKDGQTLLLRPIKPEDERAHHDFLAKLTAEDLYFRFFRAVSEMTHENLARFTQIDYDREMAFIAVGKNEHGQSETWGVARAISDVDNREAEFAIVVRSDLHHRGIGSQLLEKLLRYSRTKGIKRVTGLTMSRNQSLIKLAESFGFETTTTDEGNMIALTLDLAPTDD
jgi:acetyltransferase